MERLRNVRYLPGFWAERTSEILALWDETKPSQEGGDGRLELLLALARARLEARDEHPQVLADARTRLEERVRFLEGKRAEAGRAGCRA